MESSLDWQRLQQLEEEAWQDTSKRCLYATEHIAGFPWCTVVQKASANALHAPRSSRRHVVPYDFTFRVFVKGRWVGHRLLDVYSEELAHHSPAYYKACLAQGRLRCVPKAARESAARVAAQQRANTRGGSSNLSRRSLKRAVGEPAVMQHVATPDPLHDCEREGGAEAPEDSAAAVGSRNVVLQHGDVVLHTVHRHEIPVQVGSSGVEPIYVLAVRIKTLGLLSVLKPTGIPTHPTGRYQYNSLLAMVEYVLAPKRLRAWLYGMDPLLQSLVSTAHLSDDEVEELWAYYHRPVENTDAEPAEASARRQPAVGEQQRERADSPRCTEVQRGHIVSAREEEPLSLERAPRPCHRLDKVTSGVLLLGVHRRATQRVSVALMEKSKAMDEAIQAALRVGAHEGACENNYRQTATHSSPESGVESSRPLQTGEDEEKLRVGAQPRHAAAVVQDRVMAAAVADYGVRKRYIAQVSGRFPGDSPALLHAMHRAREDEAARLALRVEPRAMRSMNAECLDTLSDGFGVAAGDGVLLVSDVTNTKLPAASARHAEPSEDSPVAEKNSTDGRPLASIRVTVTDSAATLVQPISYTSAASSPPALCDGGPRPQRTVVQCVPLTGRLHQIRAHLSEWGFPIVGDVPYGGCRDDVADTQPCGQHPAHSLPPPSGEQETTASTGGTSTPSVATERAAAVYFDWGSFPPACRAHLATGTGSCSRSDQPSDKSCEAEAEPLCYECAGRLPIATMEDHSGASAIHLHAWRYELSGRELLSGGSEDAVAAKGLGGVSSHAASATDRADGPHVTAATAEPLSTRFAQYVPATSGTTNGSVAAGRLIFSAPMPEWASTRNA